MWPFSKKTGKEPQSEPPKGGKADVRPRDGSLHFPAPPTAVNTLPAQPATAGWWHGEKFPGGLGAARVLGVDHWTLRQWSVELFKTNQYARGMIRRLAGYIVHTGLYPQCDPDELILGYPEDGLGDWALKTETRFSLWAKSPRLCDFNEKLTFSQIQKKAFREAKIEGDVLVMLVQDQRSHLPRVRLVSGCLVQSPFDRPLRSSAEIRHGVELDADGRHVAYWVQERPMEPSRRVPAHDSMGRPIAWLVYGSDHLIDGVRGEPFLSLAIQSLKDIDRYQDAAQRKALLNAMLAIYVKREADAGNASRPLGTGAVRRAVEPTVDSAGTQRSYRTMEMIPGLVIDELAKGEDIHGFPAAGTDLNFPAFQKAILSVFAFASGVPPEVYFMSFDSNYSASAAANGAFRMVIAEEREDLAAQFLDPVYADWLHSSVLLRTIDAPGFLESLRLNGDQFISAAWLKADWSGTIIQSVDPEKTARAYEAQCRSGFMTRQEATRSLNGGRFMTNVRRLARENALLADAVQPLLDVEEDGLIGSESTPEPRPNAPDDANQDDEQQTTLRLLKGTV